MTKHERAAQIWPILSFAAKNRQLLTYGIVGKLIGVPRQGIGKLLGPTQSYCLKNHLPALTNLVVSKDTGIPSEGFIENDSHPKMQQKVFNHDWLTEKTPSPEELKTNHA